jgi:ABC-2 type transport system permease protein
MQNVIAIFQRELGSYFDSPLAYIIIPVFLGLVGGFSLFFQDVLASGIASMRTVFFWSAVSFLLLIPAVTMRLFAEEKRTGSIELLVTMPVTEAQMVLGKFLAALCLMTIALALTFTWPVTLYAFGTPDVGPLIGGYLGLFLIGAAFTAVGTAASALTSNQVVSFLVALLGCLVPFVSGYALARVPAPLLPIIQYLSTEYHFENLARGVVDSRNIIFYLSVVALFLHVAVFALERRRLV